MQVETSYDKIVLDHQEVQEALRDYIIKHMPGRIVRGDVVTNHSQRGNGPSIVVTEKSKPQIISSAHCYLEPINFFNGNTIFDGSITASKLVRDPDLIDGDIRSTSLNRNK